MNCESATYTPVDWGANELKSVNCESATYIPVDWGANKLKSLNCESATYIPVDWSAFLAIEEEHQYRCVIDGWRRDVARQ